MMNVCLVLCLISLITIFGKEQVPYKIPYNYYDLWVVVGRNSSGQLFFDTDLLSRRIFIWKPYNDSILPSIFLDEEPPKILQDPVPPIATGNLKRTLQEDIHVPHQSAFEKTKETIPSQQRSGIHKTNAPVTAALERPPPGKTKSNKTVSPALGMNVLHHSIKIAELMATLSRQRNIPDLETPAPRNATFNSTPPSMDKIVYAEDELELAKESSRLYYARREKLRIKRQISPDVATELNLNDAQLSNMQAQVNRRFLVGYDCTNPQEIKPISSFIQDPCEPTQANEQDTYEVSETAQYQLVQYETRREFEGTRCEKYISKFTYYCGNTGHASPYPQEIYYRRPKILHGISAKN